MALDHFDKYKLDQINQNLSRLRWQTAPSDPNAPPPEKGTIRRGLSLGLGFILIVLEAIVITVMSWQYLASEKGLRVLGKSGKTVIESLHWDPFLALIVSVAAGILWCLLFVVPIVGPVVGVVISMAWGSLVFMASESAGFAIFVFLLSLLMRMSLRVSNKRPHWMAALEWGLVVIVAVGVLAPFSPNSKLPGLGLWSELRSTQDTISCGKELRRGPWKGQYTENPAFYAHRKACAAAKASARLKQAGL